MDPRQVAIVQQENRVYPETAPFHPAVIYPETPIKTRTDSSNAVYESVRSLFKLLRFDLEHEGSPEWNPLGWLIRPGETVFIKPNMISHKHLSNNDWNYVITHGAVIRAVVDYIYIALRGEGKIIIGDAPQTDSKFDIIIERMGLSRIQQLYKTEESFDVEVIDLRDEHWNEKDGIYVETIKLPGDPRGSLSFDLANDSMFAELDGKGKQYYGAFYDILETNEHHRDGKHEYAISKSPITADVFINVPKLKTHKKCGLTVNLKSLVGINANKNWLPHYIFGSPESGGDQFDKQRVRGRLENSIVVRAKERLLNGSATFKYIARNTKRAAYQIFGTNEEVVRSGNWHGNDTVWRMSVDLNRILLYANPDGTMRSADDPKRYFSVVDGVYAMEGNGPVAGTLKPAGLILGGANPVAVDAVCALLMGLDSRKLHLISRSFADHRYPLVDFQYDDILTTSNEEKWDQPMSKWKYSDLLHFKPHFGWAGEVELDQY